MRDQKRSVMLLPGPATECDDQDVRAKERENSVKPKRPIDPVLSGRGVVERFDEGRGDQRGG